MSMRQQNELNQIAKRLDEIEDRLRALDERLTHLERLILKGSTARKRRDGEDDDGG